MPYIPEDRRDVLDWEEDKVNNPGELNYVLTRTLLTYLAKHGTSYQTINDCLGALEGAKNEFYRRIATPYEDKKKDENGDCY